MLEDSSRAGLVYIDGTVHGLAPVLSHTLPGGAERIVLTLQFSGFGYLAPHVESRLP